MLWGRLSHGAKRTPFALGVWLVSTLVLAQPTPSTHFQVDVGVGHEQQTSPLFQISPQSNILYLDGVDRLSGTHARTALQGTKEWMWSGGVVIALAADATFKRAPAKPGFDFASLSVQPTVHVPVGSASVGVGLNLQTLDVAGQHFRDVGGVQTNWTWSDGKRLWGIVIDTAVYKHSGDLVDMDAAASSLVVLRQISDPLPGLDGIDFSGIVGREHNERGIAELSSRSAMLTVLVRWSGLGAHWSIGRGWRQAVFDDTAFVGEPMREDRTAMLDLAVQWPLSAARAVRVEFNESHNTSTTHLYDNLYRQISVTLRSSF